MTIGVATRVSYATLSCVALHYINTMHVNMCITYDIHNVYIYIYIHIYIYIYVQRGRERPDYVYGISIPLNSFAFIIQT